jgi:hypothetical protein
VQFQIQTREHRVELSLVTVDEHNPVLVAVWISTRGLVEGIYDHVLGLAGDARLHALVLGFGPHY